MFVMCIRYFMYMSIILYSPISGWCSGWVSYFWHLRISIFSTSNEHNIGTGVCMATFWRHCADFDQIQRILDLMGKLAGNGLSVLDIASLWIRSCYVVALFPRYLGKLVFCMSYKRLVFVKKKKWRTRKYTLRFSLPVSTRYLFW